MPVLLYECGTDWGRAAVALCGIDDAETCRYQRLVYLLDYLAMGKRPDSGHINRVVVHVGTAETKAQHVVPVERLGKRPVLGEYARMGRQLPEQPADELDAYRSVYGLTYIHNKIRKETHQSLVGERNCASYDVVIVVDSGQFLVTDRVG